MSYLERDEDPNMGTADDLDDLQVRVIAMGTDRGYAVFEEVR